jgi:hypothetical protein
MRFLGGIGEALKDYMVVFKVLRYGSYIEDAFVQASSEKQAKQIGEKVIRGRFAPRTKMEFVEVYEVK